MQVTPRWRARGQRRRRSRDAPREEELVTDSATQEIVRSRRALLAAAAGGAAALAATALRPVAVEAAPYNLQAETNNATSAVTSITNSTADSDGFWAAASATGIGVGGGSEHGTGLAGSSHTEIGTRGISSEIGDPASNIRNAGVVGVAGTLDNIASNIALTGVYGYSDPSVVDGFVGAGVWGDSADFGVIGTGAVGVFGDGFIGVLGVAEDAAGVGIQAETNVAGGRSLRVVGRAEFTRSGRATISAGASKKTVSLAGCTTSTLILAVLSANRSGRYVRAVVPGSGSFTIYLNSTVSSATGVTWIAFTNPSNHSG